MRSSPVLALALVAACTTTPGTPVTAPAPTPARTATPGPVPRWVVGASPLPLRPDGYGQVLPTPGLLRDRRMTAPDTLPPPADGAFHASTGPITTALRQRMGATYRPGCPVPLSRLRYLQVSFRGFDGRTHTGEVVVAATVAAAVVAYFHRLYDARFPIEQMTLPTTADVTGPPTGDGNDTAGFVCRAAVGQARLSAHAYGLALDVNPFQNPEQRGDLVLPELAGAYTDRGWRRPGMITPGSVAVTGLTSAGWTWGGTYRSLKDWMHLSQDGQ